MDERHFEEHNLNLVRRFCTALDLPPHNSAIISHDAGTLTTISGNLCATIQSGKARFSFHLYNDNDDVEAAVEFIRATRGI